MKTLILMTQLAYYTGDPIPANEVYCDAVVVCQATTLTCDVLVYGPCRMDHEQCQDAVVFAQGAEYPALECALHNRELVIQRVAP